MKAELHVTSQRRSAQLQVLKIAENAVVTCWCITMVHVSPKQLEITPDAYTHIRTYHRHDL
eukprot:COSAG02_NODE_1437_length_12606_cov_5.043336_2_plen_61_part_00